MLTRMSRKVFEMLCQSRLRGFLTGQSHRFVLLFLLALPFFLCAAPVQAQNQKRERLRIATDATYPPFEYEEGGVLKGFDIDLGNALAKEMGMTVEWVPMAWEGVIPTLNSRKVDLIMSGVTITEARKKEHAFTRPYFLSGQAIARRKGDPNIATIADLLQPGRTVAVQPLTTGEEAVKKLGMSEDRIKPYGTLPEALLAVRNKKSDAVVADLPALKDLIRRGFPELEIAPNPVIVKENVGIQARKDELALVHALNEALDRLLVNGTYARIYEQWIKDVPTARMISDLVQVKDAGTKIPAQIAEKSLISSVQEARNHSDSETGVSALAIRPNVLREAFPKLLKGALVTLQLTALALLFGISAGLIIALMRLNNVAPVRMLATSYVELIRGTPLLIQIFVIYFVLGTPEVGVNLTAFWAGVAALSFNAAAYLSEIFRAGIESIDTGQMEAARTLGMTYGQGMCWIVLPQTLRRVLPPLTNEAVALLKDSSLVSAIAVVELAREGNTFAPVSGSSTTVYLAVALVYLCMTLPLTFLMRLLEARWQLGGGSGPRDSKPPIAPIRTGSNGRINLARAFTLSSAFRGLSRRNVFVACLLLLWLLVCTSCAWSQVTAIRAGAVVDPESGEVRRNQVILIEGGKIKAIGGDVAIPAGASIRDLSRETVLPGLFDCHTHLCLTMVKPRGPSDREFYAALLETITTNSTAYRALQGAANARDMLLAGFTTVRDVGNAGNYADTDLRRAIEEGLLPGPTMINAGRIIAPFGGQLALVVPRELHERTNAEYFYADTRDELLKAVRENIFYGAKIIKLVVDDEPYIYSVEDIRFVVEEAHRAQVKVAAHGYTRAGARNAIEAGVDSVEHGYDLTDEDLRLAKQKNVVLVGTDRSALVYRQLEVGEESQTKRIDRLRRAFRIGVPMAFGSDIYFAVPGYTRGGASLTCLEPYLSAGIPPADILRMMTINAARLLGVEKERGTLRPGMAADIIAVVGNPLTDIRLLQKVDFVMKDGVVVREVGRASP